MKQQKKSKASDPTHRLYAGSEVTVVDSPVKGERLVMLRFRTFDSITGDPKNTSPTPWVTFPLVALEGLATQLAGVVETAKRWTPGEKAEMVGPGLVERGPFDGASGS